MSRELNAERFHAQPFIKVIGNEIKEAEKTFLELTGYGKPEIIGKDLDYVLKKLLRLSIGEKELLFNGVGTYFIFTGNFEFREVEINFTYFQDTEESTLFFRECTPGFEEKNRYLEQILKDEISGIAVYSAADRLLLKANKKYLNSLEAPYNEKRSSIGRRIDEIVAGWKDSPAEKCWRNAADTGRTVLIEEYEQVTGARGITYWKCHITPIAESGKIKYIVIRTDDITESIFNKRKIENQELILKSERHEKQMLETTMRMKDEFLATITHEFKTPLTVINAALQTIESLYVSQVSDNLKKHLQRIRTNTYRQLRLVNNLLDITKCNAGHFKLNKKNLDIVYLTEAIVKSVDPYARQKGVRLKFTASQACREMAIDDEKFERILLNLLSNAIKFTSRGKTIHIDVSCKSGKAFITVKDEGIGIPKSKLKIIFDRFGQVDSLLSRQAEGTGIGLSLVNKLVSAMEGKIEVDSKVGEGSTFTVTLPIRKTRRKKPELSLIGMQDSRVMQAAAIEFSDIYVE